MLDRWSVKIVKPPLERLSGHLEARGIEADRITVAGFAVGMAALPLLAFERYLPALLCIAINRICDGLDGAVARRQGITDRGGFLDIVLDFIFYAAVIFGFALARPADNALPAAALLFGFMGTGASFLGFAVMAGKRGISSPVYKNKSLYYLEGLTEGTETIAFFVLFCLLPDAFPLLAWVFAVACWITAATRVRGGYLTLASLEAKMPPRTDRSG